MRTRRVGCWSARDLSAHDAVDAVAVGGTIHGTIQGAASAQHWARLPSWGQPPSSRPASQLEASLPAWRQPLRWGPASQLGASLPALLSPWLPQLLSTFATHHPCAAARAPCLAIPSPPSNVSGRFTRRFTRRAPNPPACSPRPSMPPPLRRRRLQTTRAMQQRGGHASASGLLHGLPARPFSTRPYQQLTCLPCAPPRPSQQLTPSPPFSTNMSTSTDVDAAGKFALDVSIAEA